MTCGASCIPALRDSSNLLVVRMWVLCCLLLLNTISGYETARSLALYGATVIMACRTLDTAERCRTAITDELPTAAVEMMPLDLASLSSIKQFTDAYKARRW